MTGLRDVCERLIVAWRHAWCHWRGTHHELTVFDGRCIYTRCTRCGTRTVGVDLYREPLTVEPWAGERWTIN